MDILLLGGTGFVGTYLYELLSNHHNVDRTYAASQIPNTIRYDVTVDVLAEVVRKPYDVVINNINPNAISYSHITRATEELVQLCLDRNVWLLNISSIFADEANRQIDSYSLKKFLVDELIIQEMPEGMWTIMRFPQIFDYNGLARSSQAGLFFLINAIEKQDSIELFSNCDEPRNYLAVEQVVQSLMLTLEHRWKGVQTVYNPDHTITLRQLTKMLAEIAGYDSRKISVGQKKGATYLLPPPSPVFESWTETLPDMRYYLSKLINKKR